MGVLQQGLKHPQGGPRGPGHVLGVAEPADGQQPLGGLGTQQQAFQHGDGVRPRRAQHHLEGVPQADEAALQNHGRQGSDRRLAANLDEDAGSGPPDLAVGHPQQFDELEVVGGVVHLWQELRQQGAAL